ncbi:MAG TPA: MarC family NAAT transporter [Steroidobacteraceae bacterium]|nr:MarC family NAAT transporter [Steroidobacteraceae bacterium]
MDFAADFLSYVGLTVLTLLPIINPVGTAVLLLGIGAHLEPAARERQIRKACVYAFGILVAFLLAGTLIMQVFGISIPGLRIAGGLVIAFLGFRLLFPEPQPAMSAEAMREASEKADISFSPLAMPSLSGPGSIATVISMSSTIRHEEQGTRVVIEHVGVVIGIGVAALACYFVLRAAEPLAHKLGSAGIGAIARIMGFLMICIGVQFVINGVRELVGG